MKKLIAVLCLLSVLLTMGLTLCSCGTELDNSVKSADKQIKTYNDPEKYPLGGKYSSELVHREAEDEYDYIITVDMTTYTGSGSVDSFVHNMKQNMNGYFSDNENVTVYVRIYRGDAFICEYKDWELVGK